MLQVVPVWIRQIRRMKTSVMQRRLLRWLSLSVHIVYSSGYYKQQYVDFMVNYSGDIARDYHLTANVGTSYEEYDSKGSGYAGDLLRIANKFIYSNIDAANATPSQTGERKSNFAVFGSAELAWR